MKEQNDRHHRKNKRICRLVGLCLLLAGLVLSILGIVDFISAQKENSLPTRFFFLMIGIPLTGVGGVLTLSSFQAELLRYHHKESEDVRREILQNTVNTLQSAAPAEKTILCPSCGEENDREHRFCKACGTPLTAVCPHCGAVLAADDKFCTSCGKKQSESEKNNRHIKEKPPGFSFCVGTRSFLTDGAIDKPPFFQRNNSIPPGQPQPSRKSEFESARS